MWLRLRSIIVSVLSWITSGSHQHRHPADHRSTQTASKKRSKRTTSSGTAWSPVTDPNTNVIDATKPDATTLGYPDQSASPSSTDAQHTEHEQPHSPDPGTSESLDQPEAPEPSELLPSAEPPIEPSTIQATETRPYADQDSEPPNHSTPPHDTTEQPPPLADDSNFPEKNPDEIPDLTNALEEAQQSHEVTPKSPDTVEPINGDTSTPAISSESPSRPDHISQDPRIADGRTNESHLDNQEEGGALPHEKPIYRPPVTTPRTPRPPVPSDVARRPHTAGARHQTQPAEIKLRLLFERGGYCRVTLLPRRPQGVPEEIHVLDQNKQIPLIALEEDWYQDLEPSNLGQLLQEGIVWPDPSTGRKWVLSGRDVFVLAAAPTHRGFLSTTRLVLGQEQVIACTTPTLPRVEEVLNETGCSNWTRVTADQGAPSGWVVLRGLCPTRSVPSSGNGDILNILRPLPEIQIQFEGGIRLRYSNWLSGYPPTIHVYGDIENTGHVFIDGYKAKRSDTGGYTAPSWDSDGNHQVSCGGKTASYSLVRSEPNWDLWPAYSFANSYRQPRIAVCGPVVCSFTGNASRDLPATSGIVQVPASNPVLLGPIPGEVFIASPRADLLGAPCVLSPPFTPVWAIPAQPLRCHKPTSRILLVGDPSEPDRTSPHYAHTIQSESAHKWCNLVLDAGRKGLEVDPLDPLTLNLWHRYNNAARQLWKSHRRKK